MTSQDPFEQELTAWLRSQAPNQAPDRVLDEALHRTLRRPQTRSWFDRLAATTPLALTLRGAAVAAVIVGAVVIGSQLTSLPPGVSESPSPVPSPSESGIPSPAPAAGCPEPPYTFVSVTGVPMEDRAACFGNQEMVLTGWVLRISYPLPPCEFTPKPVMWLSCESYQQPLAFGTLPPGPYQPDDRLLWVAADPAGPIGPIVAGAESGQAIRTNTWVEVTGHFNHREARRCAYFASDPLREKCEGTFVATQVTELVAPWPMQALASSECINAPLDLLTLIFQTDPAACYGSAPITVVAEIRHPGVIDGPCLFTEPAWLGCASWVELDYVQPPVASLSIVLAISRSDHPEGFADNVPSGGYPAWLFAAIHPEAGISRDQVIGERVRVTGHFDDPAASTCRIGESAPPSFFMSPEDMIQSCRNLFVLTEIVPLQ